MFIDNKRGGNMFFFFLIGKNIDNKRGGNMFFFFLIGKNEN
jgi:hypothetical protein